ncbi:DNA methyltransferase [Vagococcus zengguangii]|uniref:DNA methyltransferase n=1 Tax=Vagococcus zengguangii TaxID=2571750 RepID=A0A4D7CS40_9ENTE|nr:DNA methyltransferase [Vagococcus zengguangii]TLG80515.1 DNA methyltransferase [Vagococcus zengguangii]
MRHDCYFTIDTEPTGDEEPIKLGQIIQSENEVEEKYYLTDPQKIKKFEYLRGPKKIERTSAEGFTYTFSEGGMSPYDDLELPGRTMLTSEGSVNRSTHLLKINGRYRLLTPIEADRLQDFPDDWTKYKKTPTGEIVEVSDRMRMFFMGNALVTEIVKRIGDELQKIDIIL